ncbi:MULTISPECIES: LPS export ABC transporter ATP-binding protein [unclassified Nitratiruptor]|uniref:LPS export ABC transporter ATP-binding protein n=1 Tax=unclassified Nitratiruptor TaxID=2624044 RepID=UPI001915A729|nr:MULTISPECIES: LPS export ABC transporter ATP-binding protein [unclassified Nitratiruptor]BCD60429.1 lipopolysaccharide export system ATP-binding protein [Nitratiruptor sp. YY08-10]BCD64082.1 lipopolysaccharide export system ATP-binding protein [Nitratiruptor sp. YY08-14]
MHRLVAKGLYKEIKKKPIVRGVTLEVQSSEVVGLLGPNGAGKTTTFYMICGLIHPTKGSVILDDEEITKLPLHEKAKKGIGYLPQESSVFKDLTVEENLYIAAESAYGSVQERDKVVEDLLELFGIEPIRHRKGIALSGGERRRCEIARSLVMKPKFLLLDEPFAGVDPIAVADIQKVIGELKKAGIGILITDHNVRETLSVCDRAYVLKDGEILASGSSEEVAEDPMVRKFYLGENFKF